MKDRNDITNLFRERLADAELPVRENLWAEIQQDMARPAATGHAFLPPYAYRLIAAASVLLVLGMASAVWYFSPKEEAQEAFTPIAALPPTAEPLTEETPEALPVPANETPTPQAGYRQPYTPATRAALVSQAEETDEEVSVQVSITITQRVYDNPPTQEGGYYGNYRPTRPASDYAYTPTTERNQEDNRTESTVEKPLRKWAVKAGLGTSLPKGDYQMPLTAALQVERRLSEHLSLETGLQYSRLAGDRTLHTLGIPVKVNARLAGNEKVDLYATLGGMAEKCIAGADSNSLDKEPIQLSVAAGMGVCYQLSDRLALFAEPTVSHHFDSDSPTRSLRSERATNLNLLCGVRMTY